MADSTSLPLDTVLPTLSKNSSFSKLDSQDIIKGSPKKHGRSRSSSSPVRPNLSLLRPLTEEKISFASTAPAADEKSIHETEILPSQTKDSNTSDGVTDQFMTGLDKWNSIFRNAMVSEFMAAKKSLLKIQSESSKKEKDELMEKLRLMKLKVEALERDKTRNEALAERREAVYDNLLKLTQQKVHLLRLRLSKRLKLN
jgi:hypothetical protein